MKLGTKFLFIKLKNKEIISRMYNPREIKVGEQINQGDIIVAEGLKKVRPRGKIKPIKDGAKKQLNLKRKHVRYCRNHP